MVTVNGLQKLLDLIGDLDDRKIFRRLASYRDAVTVEIHMASARWEVEFFANGEIEVEIFRSDGQILSGSEAEEALQRLRREDDEAEEAKMQWLDGKRV